VKVYKVGDALERQVYVMSKSSDAQWAGLKIALVET
jgi:hypothetical protein